MDGFYRFRAIVVSAILFFAFVCLLLFTGLLIGLALSGWRRDPSIWYLIGIGGVTTLPMLWGSYLVWRAAPIEWFHWQAPMLQYRRRWRPVVEATDLSEVAGIRRDRWVGAGPVEWDDETEYGDYELALRNGQTLSLRSPRLSNARRLAADLRHYLDGPHLRPGAAARRVEMASLPRQPIDDDLSHKLQPHLMEGERLLWAGRPAMGKFWLEYCTPSIAFLLLAGPGLGLARRVVASALLGLIAGAILLVAWIVIRRWLSVAAYGVTDRRVILLQPVRPFSQRPHQSVHTFDADELADVHVKRRRQDIVIANELIRDHKGKELPVEIGFHGTNDPAGALEAIAALRAASHPSAQTEN